MEIFKIQNNYGKELSVQIFKINTVAANIISVSRLGKRCRDTDIILPNPVVKWYTLIIHGEFRNTKKNHYIIREKYKLSSASTLRKTRLFKYIENYTSKNWKFSDKKLYFFHISAQNIDCGYSLEPPRRGGSNEYPQYMF